MNVYCCGFNGFGQLGSSDSHHNTLSLFKISNVIDMAFSLSSLVVLSGTEIFHSGFIGDEENQWLKIMPLKKQKAVQVSCSSTQALFVTDVGRCWQYSYSSNSWRELPDFQAIEGDSSAPAEDIPLSTATICSSEISDDITVIENDKPKIVQVSCGEVINIALCENGTAYSIPSPLHIPGVKVTAVACGFEHALLLADSGSVYSWGSGIRGQLGHGELESEESPRELEALCGQRVVRIAAGGWHSATITDCGTLYTWGWNNSGQLGFPTADSTVNKTTQSERVDDDSAYSSRPDPSCKCIKKDSLKISEQGECSSCNVHTDSGDSKTQSSYKSDTLVNDEPKLEGLMHSTPGSVECKIVEQIKGQSVSACEKHLHFIEQHPVKHSHGKFVDAIHDPKYIAKFEEKHSLSIDEENQIIKRIKIGVVSESDKACIVTSDQDETANKTQAEQVWHQDKSETEHKDQLVQESVTVLAVPMPVDLPQGIDVNVLEVGCGNRHTVVLLDDGSVWGCGWNAYGQLGQSADILPSCSRMVRLALPPSNPGSKVVGVRCGAWNTALFVEPCNTRTLETE